MTTRARHWRMAGSWAVLAAGLFAVFHFAFAPPSLRAPAPAPEMPAEGSAHVDPFGPGVPPQTDVQPAPDVAELRLRCPELLDLPPEAGYPSADDASEDCRRALHTRFWASRTVEALLPLPRSLKWSDVFTDVAGRFETVAAAVRDPACQVADDDLRPDLAGRCAARAMAELAVFKDTCGDILDGFDALHSYSSFDPERHLTRLSAVGREEAVASLDAGRRYTGNVAFYMNQPRHVSDALNAPLVEQREYWHQRDRIDEDYFRTAWLRSHCEQRRDILGAMLPQAEDLGDLMLRAGGLGDEFALAHRWLPMGRALKLRDHNLLLAWVSIGDRLAADVNAEWKRAEEQAYRELKDRQPHFDNRLRELQLAGIECPSPCTPARLRETEQRFKREVDDFSLAAYTACDLRGDCRMADELKGLREPLFQAMDSGELLGKRAQEASSYGKRAEAIRMRHALAVEALAAERGMPLDVEMLRRVLANPELPSHLDTTEVEYLRGMAKRDVAHALAHPTWAVPAQP